MSRYGDNRTIAGEALCLELRAMGFYRERDWPAGVWKQRDGHSQDPAQEGAQRKRVDVFAPCGCRRLYDAKGNGSDYGCTAHSERLADGRMPQPDVEEVLTRLELATSPRGAQPAEQASGEESPTRGLRFRPLDDVEAVFRDWFDRNTGQGGTINAEQLAFEAFRAGAWWGLSQ